MLPLQKLSSQTVSRFLLGALLSLVVIALSLPAAAQKTVVTLLTSDISIPGAFMDANLVNPWGMSASPAGPWWISDNGTGLSTLYDGTGKPGSLVVAIPPASGSGTGTPTGSIFNSTTDFKISGNSSVFVFCTEDGTISGWGSGASATIAVNNSGGSAVYKGCAIGQANSNNYLYVADFHNNSVDVFDKNFAPFSFGANAFVDPNVPSGFAPFNVVNVGGGHLAVTFAKQDAAKHDDVPGIGNGYITIFDTSGNIVTRLSHVIYDNSPWAVVVAPTGYGGFAGDYLVGNFGSGAILAYTPAGAYIGQLFNVSGFALTVDGVWGLGFGNGSGSGPKTTLFFTAGAFFESHGIFGSLVPKAGPGGELQAQTIKQW
jgi:uncharacterized protein (TIGR03118 family)